MSISGVATSDPSAHRLQAYLALTSTCLAPLSAPFEPHRAAQAQRGSGSRMSSYGRAEGPQSASGTGVARPTRRAHRSPPGATPAGGYTRGSRPCSNHGAVPGGTCGATDRI